MAELDWIELTGGQRSKVSMNVRIRVGVRLVDEFMTGLTGAGQGHKDGQMWPAGHTLP